MNEIIFLVSNLNDRFSDFFKKRKKGLGLRAFVSQSIPIMHEIYKNGGKIQINELYKAVPKPKPTITEMIKRLVADGHLKKTTSEKDKRVSFIHTTKKSDFFKSIYLEAINDFSSKIFSNFTDNEKIKLKKLLEKAIANT
jgi:DNA-binding MarR family transcriptional regulator